ncbi:N-acetyltransferase [bacterium LRH843]|nr:N-acetyltransferase [bacterium LRH843]
MIAKSAINHSNQVGNNVIIKDYAVIYENVYLSDDITIGEHAVIGRSTAPTTAVKKKYTHQGFTKIGKSSSISANAVIYNGVTIGERSLIGDNSSILSNVSIGNDVLISRNITINSDVTIGDHSRIMDNSHITGRVKIGNHVFISVGVTMANDNLFGQSGYNDDVYGATIEDYVSIGVGSILLPHVTIKEGSIVSAGSVVKTDVPAGVIVAGNPAKVISRVPTHMKRN